MEWLFIWQAEDLNMAYAEYKDLTEREAHEQFAKDHPDAFAFAVICGDSLHVAGFAA